MSRMCSIQYFSASMSNSWGIVCLRLDEIAAEDHSHIATAAKRARRENTWVLVLDSSGPNGHMNQREDYEEAKKTCQQLFSRIGPSSPQTSSSRTSSIATRPTICLARRRLGARPPEDMLEWGTTLSKDQALLPQDGNRLRGGVFFMVTDIKMV